ncbi:MAG: AAA family ATPase [Planctomycetota bacterium]|nr:AAA family ATPase [Planctomycetota bacterium]
MSDFPQVFTFYSFKGGVGRSMAVLNVAYALAGRGRNVLVLDMDLEAPGLSGFLRRKEEIGMLADCDIIDLVQWAAQFAAARQAGAKPGRSALPPLTDYVVSVLPEKLEPIRPKRGELGRVDVIPVDDREDRDYYGRLTKLGIGSFNHETLRQIGSVLNVWLKSREFAVEVPEYYGSAGERTAKYDYVLVDSRTGVTEIGGLCIGPLSDHLLVFTALNDQNIAGTSHFLREVGVPADSDAKPATSEEQGARTERLGPKPTMIVATPVPSGELEIKKERLDELRRMVGTVVCQLSYHPQLALMETVFVRNYPKEYLALEYNDLVDRLMRQAKDATDFDVVDFFTEFQKSNRNKQRELAKQAIRYSSTSGGLTWPLHLILANLSPDSITDDTDFVLLDRICRILAGHKEDVDYDATNQWANVLSAWALHSTQPDLRAIRFDAAMIRYAQIVDADDATSKQKATALVNRGFRKGQLEDHEGAIADYTAVLEMPDAPAEQKAQALSNRGWRKHLLSQLPEAIADFREAISIDETMCSAHGNLAITLLVGGQAEEGLATYDHAFALATLEDVADMEQDLTEALEKQDSIPGADEVRKRLAQRRAELENEPRPDS